MRKNLFDGFYRLRIFVAQNVRNPKLKRLLGFPFNLWKRLRIKHSFLKLFWTCRRYISHYTFPLNLSQKRNPQSKSKVRSWKILYASPVGKLGKPYLAKIIHQFGHENFDYLIFNYDGTSFDEAVFGNCHIINEKGILCFFLKKYLTPEYCQKYDYIFPWVDDISIDDFSYIRFLDIFEKYQLEMGQPALSHVSLYSHEITLRKPNSLGRFTDFAEVMVQVFNAKAWIKYWELIETDKNFWGWGYDYLAKSYCGFQRIGIIDSESVTHMSRSSDKGKLHIQNHISMEKFLNKHKTYKVCEKKVLGYLRNGN